MAVEDRGATLEVEAGLLDVAAGLCLVPCLDK